MGNGASINNSQELKNLDFGKLEKLCKSGYFYQESEEYRKAIQKAIRSNLLDFLEILLISGDLKKVFPVHLACTIGLFEPLELILSAGFPPDSVDKQGRTPLHYIAKCFSTESGLCATLLCIRSSGSIQKFDIDGFTPIHYAIIESNLTVIKALLNYGANLEKKTTKGESSYELATKYSNNETKSYILSIKNNSSSKQKAVSNGDQVSEARIMQIWERFFENAFKNLEISSEISVEYPQPNIKSCKNEVIKENQYFDSESFDENDQIQYFLDWIIFYDENFIGDNSQYYAINKLTLDKYWLSDLFLLLREQYFDICDYYLNSSAEDVLSWPLPMTIQEAISFGWFTYYDYPSNYCFWINVISGQFEYYLPIASYDDLSHLQSFNLFPSTEYSNDWIEADQSCASSWVVVLIEEETLNIESRYSSKDEKPTNFYYANRITGETKWVPPDNWESLIAKWNGWMPCCLEQDPDHMFW